MRSALAPARRGVVSAGPWPASGNLKVSATTAAGNGSGLAASPAKPLTQDQVSNRVRDGFGDDSGAKLIDQRRIEFAPSEDFIQTLKAVGASEAFLAALRAAKAPQPASRVAQFSFLRGPSS